MSRGTDQRGHLRNRCAQRPERHATARGHRVQPSRAPGALGCDMSRAVAVLRDAQEMLRAARPTTATAQTVRRYEIAVDRFTAAWDAATQAERDAFESAHKAVQS